MICVLAGLSSGSPKSTPLGSGSFSIDTLSPDDLEKLTKDVMPQLKQSSYARLQNDYGDALTGLDPSASSGGKQSWSGAPDDTGYTEKADKRGSASKGKSGDAKGTKGGKGSKGRKGKPDVKGVRFEEAAPLKSILKDQPSDDAKRERDGQVKVGAKANRLVWVSEYEVEFGANSRVFKYADCQQILVDQFAFSWQEARNMCIPCGVDYEPGCSCPCPTKKGHESATSWCHRFPPTYAKTVRKTTER